jgi:hypothetical protein
MPEPLVGRHEALQVAPPIAIGNLGPSGEHRLQCFEKFACNLEVGLVARMVERDEYLV